MTLSGGTSLGPYQITAPLGKGGMGEVYRALDTRLDRDVAIKVLPPAVANDPERVARFEREARILASLSHPHIAGVYGFDESNGTRFLVMEFVDGQTLSQRLGSGCLPLDEALEVARQVAAALEEAHERGIIHRDLKPGNVMVTPEGKVKVLDFGLAKAMADDSSITSDANSPTITANFTRPGVVLGTAAYMSPEQARGRHIDRRTDIWSFGVMLYEMLTGISPFAGETVSDSIGAILHKEVNFELLPPATPTMVRHVLRRCLTRDKSMRIRDIGDARIDLLQAGSLDEQHATPTTQHGWTWLTWGLVTALVAISAAAPWIAWRAQDRATRSVIRSTIAPPEDAILVGTGDLAGPAVLSRDGSKITFVAKQKGEEQRLFLRALDSEECRSIVGTDGATFPFWSWDGQSVGFFARGELKRYDLATRTIRMICPAPSGRGGAWLADGRIVFAAGFQTPLSIISAEGGDAETVTTIDEHRHTSHRWPSPTPDGNSFIYIAVSHQSGRLAESTLYLHKSDAPDIEITRAQFPGQIVGDHIFILRDDTLYASPFDYKTAAMSDATRPVVKGVTGDITTWHAAFSAASDVLVFQKTTLDTSNEELRFGGPSTYGESMRTTLLRRDGRPVRVIADGVPQNSPSLSQGYGLLAISGAPDGPTGRSMFDIWLYRLARHQPSPTEEGEEDEQSQSPFDEPPRRLTFLPESEVSPQWSPDGEWIAFGYIANKGSSPATGLMRARTAGGQPEMLIESGGPGIVLVPTGWSSDGRYIVYNEGSWISRGVNDIRSLDLQTKKVITLVEGEKDDEGGKISPDGRWLAYESNESGEWEVYVIPFRPGWEDDKAKGLPVPSDDARWRVSIAGGRQARWKGDGRELYFVASSDSLIMVTVSADGPIFSHDAGTALFKASSEEGVQYDASADGMRFAFNEIVDEQWTTISLITNWQRLLEDD